MSTQYFEFLHALIYANYIGRFYFYLSIQPSTSYSEQVDLNIIFVSILIKNRSI